MIDTLKDLCGTFEASAVNEVTNLFKIMFVTNTNDSSKNKFRKPNILRKIPKVKSNVEKPELLALVRNAIIQDPKPPELNAKSFIHMPNYKPILLKKPNPKIKLDTYVSEANRAKQVPSLSSQILMDDLRANEFVNNNSCDSLTMENSLEFNKDIFGDEVVSFVPAQMELFLPEADTLFISNDSQMISVNVNDITIVSEDSTVDTNMFKCDFGDCKKEFSSKQKLKKHKARHNKEASKPPKIECPAMKPSEGDEERVPCGQQFTVKEDLAKHLNSDHTLDDAVHSCVECSRRFYWASGVRAHRRACGAGAVRRAPLPCPWEGCGRSFLQPCRLKEHSRAHTGARPYPCLHPNCGWSFRTASKLVRHRRRHTGERRHKCAVCGASFPRAEHLREHARRHAAREHIPTTRCNTKCNEVKSKKESQVSVVKVSEASFVESVVPPPAPLAPLAPLLVPSMESDWSDADDPFMVRCDTESGSTADAEAAAAACGRAARTHCTWPLHARPDTPAQVEASESSEWSPSCETTSSSSASAGAVRADLFLHEHVLSRNTHASGGEESSLLPAAIDADMSLPGIDLMQEELMYTDSAVDESSFQVLLLNDVDLN